MLGFICGVLTGFFGATLALVLIRNKISSKMRRITGKKRAATIETSN
jgi:hypothetical protein